MQIAHVKASGRENWGKMDRVLRMIDEARARGVDVTGDVYPYPAGSTKMDNLMPSLDARRRHPELLERLADPAARPRSSTTAWSTASAGAPARARMGWDEIIIATCSPPELEGLPLADLARQTGTSPAEAMMDLVLEQKAGVGMVCFSQSEENVAKALAHPAHHDRLRLPLALRRAGTAPGKAAPAHLRDVPAGARGVRRDQRLFSLETAVHKMTGMPAPARPEGSRALRSGYAADLALFDPATVRDESTFPDPHRYPAGIPYVIVNGAGRGGGAALQRRGPAACSRPPRSSRTAASPSGRRAGNSTRTG